MSISKVIARAWADPAYKAKLLSDPRAVLAEAGVTVPAGTTVKVVEDTADTRHLVLPVAPPNIGELSNEELERIGGGMVGPGTPGAVICWVARAAFGETDARWTIFRSWLLENAPRWFRRLYIRHGEAVGTWLTSRPGARRVVRMLMMPAIRRKLRSSPQV